MFMRFFYALQNDDIETDINKLRPRQINMRPFDELRVYEHFCREFAENFEVRTFLINCWEVNINAYIFLAGTKICSCNDFKNLSKFFILLFISLYSTNIFFVTFTSLKETRFSLGVFRPVDRIFLLVRFAVTRKNFKAYQNLCKSCVSKTVFLLVSVSSALSVKMDWQVHGAIHFKKATNTKSASNTKFQSSFQW